MNVISLPELTICTVSFGHRSLIEANINLVKKLNPKTLVRWVIVENSPEGTSGRFSVGDFNDGTVIQGIKNEFSGVAPASYHHASGLNLAIKEASTRFILVLDPDFYIVRKGWASELLEHMRAQGLTFFGVPYNPKRYMKYRYFPCIHCMCIDTENIQKSQLDFSPRYEQARLLAGRAKVAASVSAQTKSNVRAQLKHVAKMWLRRSSIIGTSRDTGYGVYEVFIARPECKVECVQPVFSFSNSVINPRYLTSLFNRLIEKILPDRLCYIPKRANYFTQAGFEKYGVAGVFSRGWDEFMWKNRPFGFHLQGARRDGKTTDHSSEIPTLLEIFKICENIKP
jgi:hypothetical protein